MEGSKAFCKAIYVKFDSGESIEDSGKQVKDGELAIYAAPDNESTLEMQIIEHFENFICDWRNAKELLELYESIIYYNAYLIW